MEVSDNSFDLGEDYLDFQTHQLWATSTVGSFLSGSMSELPFQYYLANITDMDQMFFDLGCCAVSIGDPFPKNFNKTIYTIECNTGHPGYTRLRLGNTYLRKSEFMFLQWPINGPANKGKIISGARSTRPIQTRFGAKVKMSTDIVNCVFCPYWPVQASEWGKRPRHNGWPSAKVIEEVLKGGCHVVPKSHPSCSDDDTVFRFSFSRAETVLINSWNSVQKYVYHIIRLLKKDLHDECGRDGHKSAVCTYYLKTLLFWACEVQPSTFWDEGNLEESIGELICQLIEWLIDKRCPNYFIPENNMMGHFPESIDFEKEITILLRMRQQAIRKRIADSRIVTPNCSIISQISNRLSLLMQLSLSAYRCIVHPIKFPRSQRFSQSKPRYCHIAALEFGNLYRGIAGHLRLASGGTGGDSDLGKFKITLDVEKYLSVAFTEDTKGESQVALRLDETILDFIDSRLFEQISRVPDKNQLCVNSSSDNTDNMDRWIGNNDDKMAILSSQESQLRKVDASVKYIVANNVESSGTCAKLMPGTKFQKQTSEETSATNTLNYVLLYASHQLDLKASYFVSAAYLANFYYTLHHDCERSLDICDIALKNINRLFSIVGRASLYMNFCAVVLSTRWMPIFDRRIQTVFGFVALFSCIHCKQLNCTKRTFSKKMIPLGVVSYDFSNNCSTPPPIILRLIPIHFLQYIAFQCTRQLKQANEKETDEDIPLSEFCSIFSEDPRSCILSAALRIPL